MSSSTKITLWHERRLLSVDSRLTTQQARGLLLRNAPELSYQIEGRAPCIWHKGETVVLDENRLSIEIVAIRPKAGRWAIEYRIIDHRPQLLGSQTGYTDDTRRSIGATTRHLTGNLRDEPEAVDPFSIGRTSSDLVHRERREAERSREQEKRTERQQLNRLRDTRRQAIARGLDVSDLDVSIEREIGKLQSRFDEAV